MTQGIVGNVLGEVAAARWALPVRTPSDQAAADRAEAGAIDAAWQLVNRTPIEYPRVPTEYWVRGQLKSASDTGSIEFAIGADATLRIEPDRYRVVIQNGAQASVLWGDGSGTDAAEPVAYHDGGISITVMPGRVPGEANAIIPARLDVSGPGGRVEIRAASQ